MAAPKSTSLFHFTKSLEALESIVLNGFYPRLNAEDVSWVEAGSVDFVVFPMVCFCDIPLGRIADHVDFYGEYGLGMSKDWALKNGLNPIFYLSSTAAVAKSFVTAIRAAVRADEEGEDKDESAADHLHFMWAHSKPLSGRMVVGDKPVTKDFYLENEWRYVPNLAGFRRGFWMKRYEDTAWREEKNNKLQVEAVLRFTPSDVRYLFVPRDADIPPLVDFINTRLAAFPLADLKILLTRITSLEHIRKDI